MGGGRHYNVAIRKPRSLPQSVIDIGSDSFRFGSLQTGSTPNWSYEIPYSEIVTVEHQTMRGVVRGTLKDGSEFDFRIQADVFHPTYEARAAQEVQAVLAGISPGDVPGSSVKSLGGSNSQPAQTQGCGCASALVVATSVAWSLLGLLVLV